MSSWIALFKVCPQNLSSLCDSLRPFQCIKICCGSRSGHCIAIVVRAASNTYIIAYTANQHIWEITLSPCYQLRFRLFPKIKSYSRYLWTTLFAPRCAFIKFQSMCCFLASQLSKQSGYFPLTVILCNLSLAHFSSGFQTLGFFCLWTKNPICAGSCKKHLS